MEKKIKNDGTPQIKSKTRGQRGNGKGVRIERVEASSGVAKALIAEPTAKTARLAVLAWPQEKGSKASTMKALRALGNLRDHPEHAGDLEETVKQALLFRDENEAKKQVQREQKKAETEQQRIKKEQRKEQQKVNVQKRVGKRQLAEYIQSQLDDAVKRGIPIGPLQEVPYMYYSKTIRRLVAYDIHMGRSTSNSLTGHQVLGLDAEVVNANQNRDTVISNAISSYCDVMAN